MRENKILFFAAHGWTARLIGGSCRVFLGCTQCQGQRVHPALFRGAEFVRQGGVHSAGPSDTVDALEGRTDQQDAVMGLATRGRSGVAGVMGTVVLDPQKGRREGARQGCMQAIGAGGGG
jgi:hypothetical protein